MGHATGPCFSWSILFCQDSISSYSHGFLSISLAGRSLPQEEAIGQVGKEAGQWPMPFIMGLVPPWMAGRPVLQGIPCRVGEIRGAGSLPSLLI